MTHFEQSDEISAESSAKEVEPLSADELASLLVLHHLYISVEQFEQIVDYFGSFSHALAAGESDWRASQILSQTQLKKIDPAALETFQRLRDEALLWGQEANQHWITWQDSAYPEHLKTIADPPPILGVRGDLDWLKQPQVAIVGSRHASRSAVDTAKDFAHHLANQGLTITSGLALGIDTAAHQGGLQGAGKTIAVVATGLDRIYPAANQNLGRQVAEEGAMVSEFPLGTKPLNFNFPRRNRIISGLSLGTLVVEAALKSGSLITARTAMEQGREVFAVPGSIHNPQAKGCHQLIKGGAKLVESGEDILEELVAQFSEFTHPPLKTAQPVQSKLAFKVKAGSQTAKASVSNEDKLLRWIEYEPISLDELAVFSKMPVSEIQSSLLLLELTGKIEKLSAGRWRKI